MVALLYVGAARKLFDEVALSALLTQCRQNNAARGVTGMLLYSDGNFMQALAGEAAMVDALAEKIAQDPRHHAMKVMLRQPIEQRQFSGWSMALRRLVDMPPEERSFCRSLLQAELATARRRPQPPGCSKASAARWCERYRLRVEYEIP